MMDIKSYVGALALGVTATIFLAACQFKAAETKGKPAPPFEAVATDGKACKLETLVKNGPIFLYFIKPGCPINEPAAPHYAKIAEAYKKATFLGVIHADMKGAKKWVADHKVAYPLIADDMKIIDAYRAERSPWVIEIEKGGKIGRTWRGVSQSALTELNNAVALAAGAEPAQIDFSGAPIALTAG